MSNPDQLIRELRDTLDEARSYVGGPQFSPSMDSECADVVHKATVWLDSRPTEAAAMAATVPAELDSYTAGSAMELSYRQGWNECRASMLAMQAPVAGQPAEPSPAPEGFTPYYVKGFDALFDALNRAVEKGYMPDAIYDAWLEFDYRLTPTGDPPMTTERQLFEDATYNEDRMTAREVWQAARATPAASEDPPGDNFGSAEHWKEKAQAWAAECHKLRQDALLNPDTEDAAKRERAACLAAVEDVDEPSWYGYECPNTFQDGVSAAADAIRKMAVPKGDSNG